MFADIASGDTDAADIIFLIAGIVAFLAVIFPTWRAKAVIVTEPVLVALAVCGIAVGLLLL